MTQVGLCDFFIIGAAKSGTTSLHARLSAHPDLFLTTPKEPEFFARDERYAQGITSYEALFADRKPGQLCGEASTLYSLTQCFPKTAERIHAYRPDAKIIYMMREPVGRTEAYARQILKNYQRTTKDYQAHRSLEDCLFGDRAQITPRTKFFADFDSHFPDVPELFTGGSDYLQNIDAYEAVFPRENILYLLFEDFIRDQDAVCQQVLEFLGVDPEAMPRMQEISENRSSSHALEVAEQTRIQKIKRVAGPAVALKNLLPTSVRTWLRQKMIAGAGQSNNQVGAMPPMTHSTRQILTQKFYKDFARLEARTGLDMRGAWGDAVPTAQSEASQSVPSTVAAVVIGRNEGARLEACLTSLAGVDRIVYVDSGSTDGSVEMARARDVDVVELDLSQKFTAARARNAGLEQLNTVPEGAPDFVQFVDGDCEMQPDWIESAVAFLQVEPKAAVVCGRRRERFPDASMYNGQCDREWDTPIGAAKACGGDALMRFSAVMSVEGYNPALIAGEEPEMCVRLRTQGWSVHRIDAEMTLHDAAMTQLSQFWKRARRAGHAYAEGASLHGAAPECHFVQETRRALLWGAALPITIVAMGAIFWPAFFLIVVYPLQVARLAKRGGNTRAAWEEASLLTVSKIAEALGVLEFYLRKLTGRRAGLIEYK